MLSFKSVVASLTLVAFALAPIADARSSTHKTGVLAARGVKAARAHANPSHAAVNKRAAPVRAPRKQKPSTKLVSNPAPIKAPAAKGKARSAKKIKSVNPYASNARFTQSKAAKYATGLRCGSPTSCNYRLRTRGLIPENSTAVCLSGRCAIRCDDGFAPGGANGQQCVEEPSSCAGTVCTDVANAFNTCIGSICNVSCKDGYTLFQAGNQVGCFAITSDPANCSAPGRACPGSYNGVGEAKCIAKDGGSCTLACPLGTILKGTASAEFPFTCYGQGVPLTEQ